MKSIKLFRTVKQSVTFYEDDFNTIEEYNKFVDELINDGVFALDTFYDNCLDCNEEIISNIEIEE